MSTTVGDHFPPEKETETYVCLLPRKFYGPESPCSRTDDFVTGAPQDPWVQGPGFSALNWLFYGGLALLVFWLIVRALEAYSKIRD